MVTQILLNPVGSGGDVFPFLPIGMELQKRGHHVALMANPNFQENAGHANVEFEGIGTRESIQELGKKKDEAAWKTALRWGSVGTMRESYEKILERSKRCPTLVLSSPLSFGARIAAQKNKIPQATLLPSPFVLRSEYDSPVTRPMVLSRWVPRMTKRLQYWFADRFVIDPTIRKDVNAFMNSVGLDTPRRFLHRWFLSTNLVLGLFPDFFAPPQPDWPETMRLVGPVVWDPPAVQTEGPTTEEFLQKENAIIVVGGSLGIGDQSFYKNMINAAEVLGRKLVLLERNPNAVPKELPKHVIHSRYYPLDKLLGSNRMTVHTGSIGATLRSLNAGCAQLILPRVNDQHDNANRIRRISCGRILSGQPTTDSLVSKIQQMDSDSNLQKQLQKYSGFIESDQSVTRACDLIEELFDRHKNVQK